MADIEAQLLLCDAAVADQAGKLHMLGAGWSVTSSPTSPQAVAVLLKIPWDRAVEGMRNPTATDWARIAWLGAGAAVMGVLIFLRTHIAGWVIHPIGYFLATSGAAPGSNAHMWVFTGAAAWVAKTAILRLAGVEAYERWKPFFGGV